MLKIREIYTTIQPQGRHEGYPTVMIELAGENIDGEPNKKDKIRPISVRLAESRLYKYRKYKRMCFCGAEPLLQKNDLLPLIYCYNNYGHYITICTSNTIPLDEDIGYKRSHSYLLSIRCPSTGDHLNNVWSNLDQLQFNDEILFRIKTEEDLTFAKNIIKKYTIKANTISFTPEGFPVDKIAEMIIKEGFDAKINLLGVKEEELCLKKKK